MKKVVLIGDSIRMGYQEVVQEELEGQADLWWPEDNGFDSRNLVAKLDEWLVTRQPDVVHINAGLHDLKRNRETSKFQVPLEEYAQNIEKVLTTLCRSTQAKVIWAATTPVNGEWHRVRKPFDRYEADVIAYNSKAAEICGKLGVAINDLYGLMTASGVERYLSPDGVHYNQAGYELMGLQTAKVIRQTL